MNRGQKGKRNKLYPSKRFLKKGLKEISIKGILIEWISILLAKVISPFNEGVKKEGNMREYGEV